MREEHRHPNKAPFEHATISIPVELDAHILGYNNVDIRFTQQFSDGGKTFNMTVLITEDASNGN